MNKQTDFCGRTRREFLHTVAGGFSGLALTGMLGFDGFFNNNLNAADKSLLNPLKPKKPHHQPKAKSVIFLYMYGGPSQVDTFDYKPKLYPLDGKTIDIKTFGRGGRKNKGRIVGPKWKFKQYGQSGKWVSDLFLSGLISKVILIFGRASNTCDLINDPSLSIPLFNKYSVTALYIAPEST